MVCVGACHASCLNCLPFDLPLGEAVSRQKLPQALIQRPISINEKPMHPRFLGMIDLFHWRGVPL